MKKYLMKTFALDDVGAKNLIVASVSSFFATMAILFTNLCLIVFVNDILVPILDGNTVKLDITKYVIYIISIILLLLIAVSVKYKFSYIPAYMVASQKRVDLAERLRKLPLSYFGKRDVSDVTTAIMKDVAGLEDVFSAYLPTIFSAIVSTIIMCIGMLVYDYRLGFAVFWCVPVSLGLFYATKNMQTNDGKKPKKIVLEYLDKLQETVENISDIKANNREEFHKEEMFSNFAKLEKTLRKLEIKLGTLLTSIQMILKIGMASTVVVSSYLLIDNELSIVEFVIFLLIAIRIYEPLLSAMTNLAGVFQSFYSINRMKEFGEEKLQEGRMEVDFKNYDIEFDNVSFSYNQDEDTTVLDAVSLTAKQGEVTALIGPSGGGKSTVLRLASRFWDLNNGKITLGGENIMEIDPETLLKSISIVFQDVILFNNTVMENIRLGRKDATDEEVIEAAKNAKCHDFIMQMPEGYQTMIGENGSKISGGERQRLSIARALLKDAPVVFLDEATSSLDIKNETAVQEAISNLTKNKTVVVIAHRMRTIMGADKIIVLKNGKVVQEGTHEQLVSVEGEYQTMVNLQTQSANWKLTH